MLSLNLRLLTFPVPEEIFAAIFLPITFPQSLWQMMKNLHRAREFLSCCRASQVRRVIFAIFYFLGMKKNDNNVIFMRFLWNELFRSRFLFLSPSRLTWEKWFHLSSPASWRTLFRRCLSFEWLGSRLSAGREIFFPLDAISLDIAWNIIKNGFVFGIFTAFEYQGWIKHFSISEINFARYSAWRLS